MAPCDEAGLARAAAGGDGHAFAQLYDAYESRIYTFCLRIVGRPEDAADATQDTFVKVLQRLPAIPLERELNIGAYLFTAARNASYDVIGRRRRAEPVDVVPETGARGVGGIDADERGVLDHDPERAALLEAHQGQIQAANARLPARQREVLALREVEEMSYDEIAAIMDMNRNSVAQLISRARIRLRDELRGTALTSVAASSPACKRALPLIALRQDRQLDAGEDRAWLEGHLGGCDTCRVSVEAMHDAGMSYRAWAPVLPAAWLWKATAARAADLTGSDWTPLLDRTRERRPAGDAVLAGSAAGGVAGVGVEGGSPDRAGAVTAGPSADGHGRRRRGGALAGSLVLILVGLALLGRDELAVDREAGSVNRGDLRSVEPIVPAPPTAPPGGAGAPAGAPPATARRSGRTTRPAAGTLRPASFALSAPVPAASAVLPPAVVAPQPAAEPPRIAPPADPSGGMAPVRPSGRPVRPQALRPPAPVGPASPVAAPAPPPAGPPADAPPAAPAPVPDPPPAAPGPPPRDDLTLPPTSDPPPVPPGPSPPRDDPPPPPPPPSRPGGGGGTGPGPGPPPTGGGTGTGIGLPPAPVA